MEYTFTANAFVSITIEAKSEDEARARIKLIQDGWEIDRVNVDDAELEAE